MKKLHSYLLAYFARRLSLKDFVPAIIFLGIFIFYLACVNHTEPTEIGIARNRFTGEIYLQDRAGWKVTAPWVSVVCIDTRPMRVSVQSSGHGVKNRLVQFDARYYRMFVDTEGFRYYWWANRISFNIGYAEESRGLKDILRGYAFGNKRYPFLRIIEE